MKMVAVLGLPKATTASLVSEEDLYILCLAVYTIYCMHCGVLACTILVQYWLAVWHFGGMM